MKGILILPGWAWGCREELFVMLLAVYKPFPTCLTASFRMEERTRFPTAGAQHSHCWLFKCS